MKTFGSIRALDNSDDQPEEEGARGDHDDRGLSDNNDEVAVDSDEEDDDELMDTNGRHNQSGKMFEEEMKETMCLRKG
jgi:hypothetical protein